MIVSTTASRPATLEELLGRDLAARLDRLDITSRKVFAGKLPGERRSKRRGNSVEFDDYRNYVPGDDLRHIDWNVFARLDRFFLKVFREDEDLALHVLIDASPSMHAGAAPATPAGRPPRDSKLVYAHRVAMALAYIGLVNQNRVSLASFGGGGGVRRLTPLRGRRGVERVAAFLLDSLAEPLAADGERRPRLDFRESMKRYAASRLGQGVLVLLSDMLIDRDLEDGLGILARAGHGGLDATCVQILSPGELDPGTEAERGFAGDLRLTDIERGTPAEVTISPALLKTYHQRLDAHLRRVANACRARGVRHTVVSTETPVGELITGALRRGRVVG